MRLLAALMLFGSLLVATGCGAVDDIKKEAGDAIRKEVASQCRTEAKKIEDRQTRKSTLEACDAAQSGSVEEIRTKLAKACLDSADDITDSAERKQAKQQCGDIRDAK